MKTVRIVLALCVLIGLASSANAAEKAADIKKKIVGKWEVTKAAENTLPVGTILEYKADGKFVITMKMNDKEVKMDGTYTVEDGAFVYKMKFMDMEHTDKITVKKLSDTELDTENPEGKGVTCKKVK
jgi:uncharacterized protein (TIGR03066 family)